MKIRLASVLIFLLALVSQDLPAQTVIARWDMTLNGSGELGDNPVVLDSATAAGQGTATGNDMSVTAAEDHLWMFNNVPPFNPYVTSTDVPPNSMFLNGSGGSVSYDASSLAGFDGALFFPSDQYGTEFNLMGGFTYETFFKTNGDQSAGGIQQLMLQAENDLGYGIVLNEGGGGNLRFAVNDTMGNIRTMDTQVSSGKNYADGTWHYLKATFDPTAGANGRLSMSVSNEDGSTENSFFELDGDFGTLRQPTQNLFIGRSTFPNNLDPRTFLGLIDEVQITSGNVGAGDQLGNVAAPTAPTNGVIARWSMDAASPGPFPEGNPATLDSRNAPGEGSFAFATGVVQDDLWFFSADNNHTYTTSVDVPPTSMFANGNNGGLASYDASAVLPIFDEGALFFDRGAYGNEMAFDDAFSVEMFFKTNGDQSSAGQMQLLNQGESSFRYGLIVNESGSGEITFAVNDDQGTVAAANLGTRNFADGEWHYVLATYDPAQGANGTLSLAIGNEDGTASEVLVDLSTAFPSFQGLPTGPDGVTYRDDGNLFLGAEDFTLAVDGDPRRFNGLIDEVQITRGVVSLTDRLGQLNLSMVTGDFNNDMAWDCADIDALTAAIASGSTDLSFDMNGDGQLTLADVTDPGAGWLAVGGANNPTQTGGNAFLPGDANLDGSVDGQDFILWNDNKFTATTEWCKGNFTADAAVDGQDFIVWNDNKFQSSDAVNAVPEPTTCMILLIACCGMLFARR